MLLKSENAGPEFSRMLCEFEEILKTMEENSNKHSWNSDMILQRSQSLMLSLKINYHFSERIDHLTNEGIS